MDVLRLQEQVRRAHGELADLRQQILAQQQKEISTVPLAAYDSVRDKAVALLQRSLDFARWRRMLRLWGQCRCCPPPSTHCDVHV
jgi:hypothetical protein